MSGVAERGGRLVGRDEELAVVERALDESSSGVTVALAISGDPGIGKTRLLAELARHAEEQRWLVLSGRASELERDLPYWVFVDALDEYLRTLDAAWLERLDRETDGELPRIFPALTGSGAGGPTVLAERYRVHRAVQALLEGLAANQPTVALLDDLHWADPASIDLVGALLRRPPRAPVVLALAFRSRQAPQRLLTALAESERAGGLVQLAPRPLLEPEVEELLGEEVTPALARWLHEQSGGNPFCLEQLARTAAPAERTAASEPGATTLVAGAELPQAVATSLDGELAGLSTEARALLEAAAVVGDPFELDFAIATAELAEPPALAALDELLSAGLVQRTDVPRRFRFRHPLLRRVAYDAAAGAWRHAAHERAARALAAHGESPAARAHHVEQFAALGDRDAIRLLREAADASAERAPASAAHWYRAALRLLPRDAEDAAERAELLAPLAGALAGIGQYDGSREALLELLAVLPQHPPAPRVPATAACAAVEHLLGRHDEAHARLVQALDELDDPGSHEAAALLIDLAMDAFYGHDYEQMRGWAARALDVAEPLADEPLEAAAHAVGCIADAYSDRIASALVHHAEALRLVDRLGDDALARRLDAIANLGGAEVYLGLSASAVEHARRGLALGRATGRGELHPILTQELAVALYNLGRLDEAREHLDEAVEAARLVGNAQSVSWTLDNKAWTEMLSGDLEVALQAAEESVELMRSLDHSILSTWAGAVLGAILIETGEPARGVELIREAGGGPELAGVPGYFRVLLLERVTHALLTLGRRAEAAQAAAQAEERAAATGLAMNRAHAAHARAALLLAAGDAAAAAARALEGAAAADEIDARIEAARCRTLAGRALHAAGEPERAAEVLTAAAAAFEDCGALRYRDAAERELRRLGRRDHRRRGARRPSGDGLGALTARELEIARLVVDRRTNPEIAAELFLSQKTVETHLRNAFRKLDVTTRVELARAVERADRSP